MSEESYDDWEDRANDLSDEENDAFTKVLVKEPEPVLIEEKSTKNMDNDEIDDLFSSMAEVVRIKDDKKGGLPDDFSLETESDFSALGEYIGDILSKNEDKKKTYKFFRSLLDNGIKNLDDTCLAECKTSFMVEINERTKNKKVKKKQKKKKAGIRMDNNNHDSSRYDDSASFADF